MSAHQLTQFLEHVLPADGKYIYTWKRSTEKWMQQAVAQSLDDLATAVLNLSARGYDTYFACSAYTGEPLHTTNSKGESVTRYRTAEQASGTKCLWIDIDVGESKGYATFEEAEQALFAWLDGHGLPEPTIVYSGGGLHIYWVLERTLSRAEWEPIAFRLKAYCNSTGLKIDQTRTADIASVLRPPETLNYKREEPSKVELAELQPPVPTGYWLSKLPYADVPRVPSALPVKNKYTNIYAEVPSDPLKIAEACPWVREVGVELRGNVEEPLWYGLLGLLVFATEAEDIAQEWSMGHPDWDYDATEIKMDQARANQSGPTTCAKFERLHFAPCQDCPHRGKITTPLQLGRPQPPSRDTLSAIVEPKAAAPAGAIAEPEIVPLIAWPYFWTPDGGVGFATRIGPPEQQQQAVIDLYRYPLFIVSMRRAELSGLAHAVVKHWAPHDGWQEANLPAGDLTSSEANRILANAHIEVSPKVSKQFQQFASQLKQDYRAQRRTELQHETFGWKDDGFLLGETLVVGNLTARAGISPELKRYADKLYAKGTLAPWSAAAQDLFRPGYEYQAMAVLASLGAPLMRFAPYPGTIYSIVSPGTGRGKTFAVEAANSVWGADQALWIRHRDAKATAGDTIKSQFRAFALFKNLPIISDELRETDPEQLRGFITGFTDGSPPTGLTRDGKMRETFGSWKTLMIVTSNKSLTDLVTVNNDPAAANRMFEIEAELPKDADAKRAARIRKAMMENHGNAGIAFVLTLLQPEHLDWAEERMAELVDQYTTRLQHERADKNGGDRFIASFFACCTVAGQLATRIGLLQVDTDHLMKWAFSRWAGQRSQIDQAYRTSLEVLSAWIREHWQNTIDIWPGEAGDTPAVRRDLVRAPLIGARDLKTGQLTIDRMAFQRWCTKENLHFLGIGDELERDGVLLKRDNVRRNLGARTPYNAAGQTSVWIIDSTNPVLSGELRDVAAAPAHQPPSSDPIPMRQPKKDLDH